MRRIAIYGDVSMNIVDGSSVWLASIAELAARIFDEVHVVLKFPLSTEVVAGVVQANARIVLHAPPSAVLESPQGGHTPESAVAQLEQLTTTMPFEAVLVRGMDAAWMVAGSESLHARLWAYVTDLPFPPDRISPIASARLDYIARRARRMFAQTESARSYLEAIVPAAAGKTLLMHPMLPEMAFADASAISKPADGVLRLVYAGKFASQWRTLEILELPRLLRERGVDARLTMIGGKFQRDVSDRGWSERMRAALVEAAADTDTGVEWLGAIPRAEALAAISGADVGLGWRAASLDSSLEVSTKALEYGAAGAVPLVNDTADHRVLYGPEYPAFVRGSDRVEDIAEVLVRLAPDLDAARDGAATASQRYSMREAEASLRGAFSRAGVQVGGASSDQAAVVDRGVRVLVSSHDFKFMGELLDALHTTPGASVEIDRWETLHRHDEQLSTEMLGRADVVLCEWAGPNLAWYSQRISPGQRLLGRLHGFELRSGTWLDAIAVDRLHSLVLVSDDYRERAIARLGIAADRAIVIPNTVDSDDLLRPKLDGSQFRLGLVGFVPFLKRPDRAVDLLEVLLAEDARYHLHVRGRAPWEYPHHWRSGLERQRYLELYQRIHDSPTLRRHVVFEEFGPDQGSWLRKIGIVLSPSDDESFHLAPAEGLASGAEAVVWDRPGAARVFGSERVVPDIATAAAHVLRLRDATSFARASLAAVLDARRRWDTESVLPAWGEALRIPRLGGRS